MFSFLRNSILATLVYYDVFGRPLTLLEIYKYLINPARISRITDGIGEIKLSDVAEELDRLVSSGVIGSKNGFYFLNGREVVYELRMDRDRISARKWKKFMNMFKPLALAPYLRGVFASGSMAINNTDEKSDFDLLVIARAGRLYTCRFFLWAISSLMGTRRKKYEKIAPNKLCFNHYITDEALNIPYESIFNAQAYINLKPVMIEPELIDRFYSKNLWLNNYIYNFHPQKEFVGRNVVPSRFLKMSARFIEIFLNSYMGDWIEKILKKYQQNLIAKNPKTYEAGGRVVFNDNELEFHPQSFEKTVISKYKEGLRRSGVVSFIEESDSGLY